MPHEGRQLEHFQVNFLKRVMPTAVSERAFQGPIRARFWRKWADQRASRTEGPCAAVMLHSMENRKLIFAS
jgi:hypothetical protein